MRASALRLLVAGLILALTPGLAEAAENLGHLVSAGHGAHAADQGRDHAPAGDEHGCSGTFHLCSCHHSPASDLLAPGAGPSAVPPRLGLAPRGANLHPEPDLPGLDRPPRR